MYVRKIRTNRRSVYSQAKSKDRLKKAFHKEEGAIDLSSIMVGIIVIGLIGGVIAATIFALIPWGQDNAAKQQLDSISSAQSAYAGLTSEKSSTGYSFANLDSLVKQDLLSDSFLGGEATSVLSADSNLCIDVTNGGKGYQAVVRSDSGKVFKITDKKTSPTEITSTDLNCGVTPPDSSTLAAAKASANMVMTIDSSLNSNSCRYFSLPIHSNANVTIDWGDGTAVTTTTGNYPHHVYTSPGEKTILIKGTFSGYGSSSELTNNQVSCVTSVTKWRDTNTTSLERAFANTNNLRKVTEIPSTVTSLRSAFNNSYFNGDISGWDTSNVTDMNSLFFDTKAFNKPIGNWNTSKVTDMSYMFGNSRAFNQPIGEWDTSNVTNMNYMFGQNEAFNQSIGEWDTSNVTNMSRMFSNAKDFDQPIGSWVTSSVTDMSGMFSSTKKFNQPIGAWDTSNVTTMSDMFGSNDWFNQEIGTWKTFNVTDMSGMFYSNQKFNQNVKTWDVSKVTDSSYFRTYAILSAANSPF